MKVNSQLASSQRILNNNHQQTRDNKSNQPSFKGYANFMRFLSDEPVWGANLVDTCSMVAPRTGIDMCDRGFNAGIETGFRESGSLGNDASIGLYGVGAGALIAHGINKKYGIKAAGIFSSDEAAEMFTAKWQKHDGNVNNYVNDIVNNIHAYKPKSAKADVNGYISIPQEHKGAIFDDLKYLIQGGEHSKMPDRWKEVKDKLSAKVLEATGTEDGLKLVHRDGANEKAIIGSSKSILEDLYKMTEALSSNNAKGKSTELLKDYKSFAKTRTGLGIAIAGAIGMSLQPLNVYLSKKRTGSDGFVGVEGRSKDNSTKFKLIKAACATGMMTLALGSMGAFSKGLKKLPQVFMEKNLYKGKNPTINHFKTVYGLSIVSRMLASRDKDELRETAIKDVLGFVNWLILGNIVTQCILKKANPKLLKLSPSIHNGTDKLYNKLGKTGKKFYQLLTSSIVSHKEILMDGLKKEGKSIIKNNGKPMSFNEMLKELPKASEARKALRVRNMAQLGGYLYSAVVLGIGIPKFNIWLTNKIDKSRKAKLASSKVIQSNVIKNVSHPKDNTVFGQMHHIKTNKAS